MTATLGAALALGLTYALVGAAVAIVATATRTLHLAVGQVLVAGLLTALVVASPVLDVPFGVAVAAAVLLGAALSASLGPLVLDRLPSGLAGLLGLVVAAGTLDALLARTVTAGTFRPAPLVTLPGAADAVDPGVLAAVLLGPPAVTLLVWLLARTRWGRRVRVVGGSATAAARAGVDPVRVRAQALALGGAAAVVAGLLAAPISFVGTGQATGFTVRGIAAAALLGRGGPLAAVAGGLLLATAEVAGASLWPGAGGEVAIALVVVAVLALRGGEHLRAWGRAW
jgi:branched-subunit amino acid ABC-type transport system permease component